MFRRQDGFEDQPVTLPCGRCIGCRLEYSRQWAMRCYHEAQLHDQNCFVTLTYDDEHLPEDWSLDLRHFQLFMKRLRKAHGEGIRFYHAGEYGAKYGRPHYHAIIFGFDFADKIFFKMRGDYPLFISADLQSLWEHGFSSIGSVTFDSAAYVARYITKKITGEKAEGLCDCKECRGIKRHYERIDPETGEITQLKPEYCTMSRGSKKLGTGGIGAGWYRQFKGDAYPSDFVIVNGVRVKPPKFYDAKFEVEDPNTLKRLKGARKRGANEHPEDRTERRLRDLEKVQLARLQLKRKEL